MSVYLCTFMWQNHPKSQLEAVPNSSLNKQMSAIVPSQPQELEISAPDAQHCLQDADGSPVSLSTSGHIRQKL